jgi:hypothetical protein
MYFKKIDLPRNIYNKQTYTDKNNLERPQAQEYRIILKNRLQKIL